MKRKCTFFPVLILLTGCFWALPQYAVNKETVQLLQQVSTMQQQLKDLQDGQTKSNAILQKLTEQILDQVTRLSASIDDIKKSNAQTQAAVSANVDSLKGNLQITQESLDELKARLTKLATDLAALKTTVQSIDSKIGSPAPTGVPAPGDAGQGAPPTGLATGTPPDSPDAIYASALSDYTSGRYKLALGEFQQYLRYYGTTPLAGNAQFYIGQIHFMQENYDDAISAFNVVVERYAEGTKVTQAIYKKGLAMEKLGQKTSAIKEFRALVNRYPNSPEAKLAAQELSKLGARSSGAAKSRTTPPRR
ncbi:MAG: tol-pal system protein YbgF [Acidobacteriia bacterium]|nr:tol-pal system protein YbgF [Terriglobia bacterium]